MGDLSENFPYRLEKTVNESHTVKFRYCCSQQAVNDFVYIQDSRALMKITCKVALLLCNVVFLSLSRQMRSSKEQTAYRLLTNYNQYLEEFENQLPQSSMKVDVTQYATGKELCNQLPCRFFLYYYEPQEVGDRQIPTILITAGIHGNEYIGPMALLHAYQHLTGRFKIIYFPVMNPSGFDLKQRTTYPNRIDPNRDYPIDNNDNCYETSATRIVDHIFRTHSIELTINLHNGGSEIGWNWGTFNHQAVSHTVEYEIYFTIGKMLKLYGGHNKQLRIRPFQIGTMTESIYPAEGTLDDWAYAASWDTSVPKKCKNYEYEPYPLDMNHGLVFLFELGVHNAAEETFGTSKWLDKNPDSSDASNGYVTRTLRVLEKLVRILDPKVEIIPDFDPGQMGIRIIGCAAVQTSSFTILKKGSLSSTTQILQTERLQKSAPQKDSQNTFISLYKFDLQLAQKNLEKSEDLTLNYSIQCDSSWVGQGRSIFAKERHFSGVLSFRVLESKETYQVAPSAISAPTEPELAPAATSPYLYRLIASILGALCIAIAVLLSFKVYRSKNYISEPRKRVKNEFQTEMIQSHWQTFEAEIGPCLESQDQIEAKQYESRMHG